MPKTLWVEGDWSGAAFWLVAGALSGPVRLDGLVRGSGQADEAVCQALAAAGARLDWSAGGLTVSSGLLRSFHFDARDCPDMVPPLVVLAAGCPGLSRIQGVRRLAIKECDRGRSLVEMIQVLGGRAGIDVQADTLWVEGGLPLRGGAVSSYGDHRMAMAAALLSLLADGEVEIDDVACTAKSYPAFFDHLKILGGVQ
jgi:3-phosphoshikimate 1-carboxyvinyltransferase